MRTLPVFTLLALVTFRLVAQPSDVVATGRLAHFHIDHIATSWEGTPQSKGLLPTAITEAKIAIQHAEFAASRRGDLAWMKMHTRHVLHAVDPSVETKGPGLGYGVMQAARGISQHIAFASGSDGASENVRAHAVHIATTAENTVIRAHEIVALGEKVLAARGAPQAAPLVQQIKRLSEQLLFGADANGDGIITSQKGEGGLNEADKHMGFMAKGEDLR